MFLGVIAVLKLNIIATDESSYEEEENLMDDTGQIEDNEGEAQSFGDEYEEPQDQHLDEEILPPLKEEPLEEDEIIAPIDEDSDDDILPPIIE